jgi:hypothetical protein
MIYAVMAVKDKHRFQDLARELLSHPVEMQWTETGKEALGLLSRFMDRGKTLDLLITDETLADMSGRDLVEQVIMKSPVTGCAAVSTLPSDRFHDVYEGLGVLMPLPPEPDAESGKELVRILKKLTILKP